MNINEAGLYLRTDIVVKYNFNIYGGKSLQR